ncbi:sodium/hydrogen exchanger 9B2-like [Schistocerca cancellata]|uniref:sodium/hydrogen exchanger 9B2-like n=1 Tax=Schistocerca cancellata TaxID=274614 RepID=UPI002118E0A2|nr:sodium/hydrogen exchanger 9B2-like [Schistocerca cancellata]
MNERYGDSYYKSMINSIVTQLGSGSEDDTTEYKTLGPLKVTYSHTQGNNPKEPRVWRRRRRGGGGGGSGRSRQRRTRMRPSADSDGQLNRRPFEGTQLRYPHQACSILLSVQVLHCLSADTNGGAAGIEPAVSGNHPSANLAVCEPRHRKGRRPLRASTASEPRERRKSILVNADGHHHQANGRAGAAAADGEALRGRECAFGHSSGGNHVVVRPALLPVQLSPSSRHCRTHGSARRSWWLSLLRRCHQPEAPPSWQPGFWPRLCPPPLCPSYRWVARLLALAIILLLCWAVAFTVIGRDAAPGGQLFQLAVLALAAHVGGWLATLVRLPALVGMLLVGVACQNLGLFHLEDAYEEVCSVLRHVALVIILTRAGLDLDPPSLRRLAVHVLKLGLVPWLAECAVVTVATALLLGLPWIWAFLLGSVVAAVSPAVVVPCLFRLRVKGYGVAKGIPTLIIAISGIDDAASVAVFGVVLSVMFSQGSLAYQIAQCPVSVIGGIGYGIAWGFLAKYIPEKADPFVVPLRVLMLLGGGLLAVFGSEAIGFDGAGPLGCVAAAFVSCVSWTSQGVDVEDNPVATAFEIFWMIFEPILFGITGTQIKFSELEGDVVSLCIACLITAFVLRILVTILVGFGSKLNNKEKIFVALACMAKATVQAALCLQPLEKVQASGGSEEELRYAQVVKMTCVLAILLTAPTGAVLILLTGPRLLTRLSKSRPGSCRHSHSGRPSLRDISILDDDREPDLAPSRAVLGPHEIAAA